MLSNDSVVIVAGLPPSRAQACWGGSETNIIAVGEIGYGTVFKMSPDGTLVTLLSFNGTNGACPTGGLVEGADGNLYGTTRFGGASFSDPRAVNGYSAPGDGTIFRISTNGVFATTLSFTNSGAFSSGSLLEGTDGNLYGTTSSSRDYPYGYIYQATPQGDYAVIASFASTNGASPVGGMIQARDGSLYGTTFAGGPFAAGGPVANGYGAIFRLSVPLAAAPKMRALIKAETGVVLSWNALPGRSYQVQYKNALEDAAWNNLDNTGVSATNTIAFTSDTTSSAARFYRAFLLPE